MMKASPFTNRPPLRLATHGRPDGHRAEQSGGLRRPPIGRGSRDWNRHQRSLPFRLGCQAGQVGAADTGSSTALDGPLDTRSFGARRSRGHLTQRTPRPANFASGRTPIHVGRHRLPDTASARLGL
jgi:hypothetical protein